MISILSRAGAAVFLLTLFTGCGADGDNTGASEDNCEPAHPDIKTVMSGTLTVSALQFPPYVTLQGNEMGGLEGDVIARLAEMECLTVTPKQMDAAAVVPAAQAGRVDLASGNWWRTADRAEVMALTEPIYVDQVAIVSEDGASSFDQLSDRFVGSVGGYQWNAELKALYGPDQVKIYSSPAGMYNDLEAGRVGAAIDSFGAAAYAKEQNELTWEVVVAEPHDGVGSSSQPAQCAFPMSKDNEELVAAMNDNLASMRDDGTLADLAEKNGLDRSAAETGPPRLIEQ